MDPAPDEETFVTVRTTLPTQPMPTNAARPTVTTERLLLRPLRQEDLPAIRVLRTQEAVMRWTRRGRIDLEEAETQAALSNFLPPNDVLRHNCAICLRDTGELIGTGGCHAVKGSFGWPELGYMIRTEHWGGGLATEFVRGFLGMWAGLPRSEVEVRVDPRTVVIADEDEDAETGIGRAEELLIAITQGFNVRSMGVLRKCGFEHFLTWPGDETQDDKLR